MVARGVTSTGGHHEDTGHARRAASALVRAPRRGRRDRRPGGGRLRLDRPLARDNRASALLLPPDVSIVAPESRKPGNPFLRLDGIDPALSVLVTKVMADDFSDRMLKDAPDADYTVAEDPLSQAPVVVVTASARTRRRCRRCWTGSPRRCRRSFDDLQAEAGITRSARITLVPLVRDEKPQRVIGGLMRIEILLLGGGLVATVLLAGLWDAIARSRAESRSAAEDEDEPGADGPDEDEPGADEPKAEPPVVDRPAVAMPAVVTPAPKSPQAGRPRGTSARSKSARRRNARSRSLRTTEGETPSEEDGPPSADDQVDAPGVTV